MYQASAHNHFSNQVHPAIQQTCDIDFFDKLEVLSQQDQWILFTSECPKISSLDLTSSQVNPKKIIQMKPSHTQSELQIVVRAIKAGNASAIVASGKINIVNQNLLKQLAHEHHCEVFFL
ncbi:SulA-like leucine-rich domain-containing protein [Vibrio marisflavi]|uniref:Superfamily II DNA and RNA helicase n=1 Tax=Vibrio marisflavi CECT 7928 TaxID=634439 RepID=A0ABN8E6Z1_9VIBR|nr:SulA-like leucine-rich domain-containing protein [Vibrio marisflavi]CAH0540211.1 hypothetical protein VMF7928_02677 [Vibrio marisflavi CECT 7928]